MRQAPGCLVPLPRGLFVARKMASEDGLGRWLELCTLWLVLTHIPA